MRPMISMAVGLFLVFMGTGCGLFGPRPERPDARAPAAPTTDFGKPTPERLARYLNEQAALLQSIESRDLNIDIRAPGANVGLDGGSLLCQKPRYFRLIGKKFGSQEVLVGSNQERFWFFIKRDPSDALFHCSYTDFEKGAIDLPFPFEPEWVLEALGMGTVDPNGAFRVEEDKNTFVLIEDTTLRGRKIRKETVFYKGTARGDQPQVKTRTMFDEKNRIICTATIKSVTRIPIDRGSNAKASVVTCPQSIKLEWPAQETELILELNNVKVNERLSMDAFQMPRLGSREVDLGRDRPTSRSGVISARGRR